MKHSETQLSTKAALVSIAAGVGVLLVFGWQSLLIAVSCEHGRKVGSISQLETTSLETVERKTYNFCANWLTMEQRIKGEWNDNGHN